MRRKHILTTCLFAFFVAPNFGVKDAFAFPLGHKKEVKKQNTAMTPQILAPGEKTAQEIANENNSSAPKQDLGPPASKEQRQEARKADMVTQARFWVIEFTKNPKDEELAVEATNALEKIGSYDKAIEIAAMSIQNFEKNPRLWKSMGFALLKSKQLQPAAQALSKSINLNNNDAESHEALGITYDNLGNFDLAEKSYNMAHHLAPNDAKILSNLGFSLLMAGNFKKSEMVLRQAVTMPNPPIQARQNLALAVGLQGNLQESQKIAVLDLPPEVAALNVKYLRDMLDGDQNRWKLGTTNSN